MNTWPGYTPSPVPVERTSVTVPDAAKAVTGEHDNRAATCTAMHNVTASSVFPRLRASLRTDVTRLPKAPPPHAARSL